MNEIEKLRKRLINLGRFMEFPVLEVEKRLTGLTLESLLYLDNMSDDEYEAWLKERIKPPDSDERQIGLEI